MNIPGTTQTTSTDITAWTGRVHHGDCLDLLPQLPPDSIDMILADLPYGTTQNKWDTVIDLQSLWTQYERVIKPRGAIVLTATQPFTATLIVSNPRLFRYEWIWEKTVGSGAMNTPTQPLRVHESVLVFYKKTPTYNAQTTTGEPYKQTRKSSRYNGRGYNTQRDHEVTNDGTRVPKSVIRIPNPRIPGGHPTQKPVELFEYLIATYTNPGDIVLDNAIGSGTTAIAAQNLHRTWIGMEKDASYVDMANKRIQAAADRRQP